MSGMISTPALLLPLVGCTLLVCTATASLPVLLQSQQQPREVPPPSLQVAGERVVVRSGNGRWYLNEQPIADARLARLLAEPPKNGGGEVVLVVGRSLTLAEVSESLAWLRAVSPQTVRLEPALGQ
jgi:hypothetical protein